LAEKHRSASRRQGHPPTQLLALRIFSYIVARDYGFAPNPFFGWCTLATCKSAIRRTANPGDWVLGTGSKERGHSGQAVYAMRVEEAMSFNDYWSDVRFEAKRPDLRGSRKVTFGDNIYRQDATGEWLQLNSHHSLHNGRPNPLNIKDDTPTSRVLVSQDFVYWGRDGPAVPASLRSFGEREEDLCIARQGHKCRFSDALVVAANSWLSAIGERGLQGRPDRW
jgi:Nucleotide modification associated domain 2